LERQGRRLAVRGDDASGIALAVAPDGRAVAVGIGHRAHVAGAVVAELIADDPREGVQGAQMPAGTVEDVNLTAILGGDDEITARKTRQDRIYPADLVGIEVCDVEAAVRADGNSEGTNFGLCR